MVSQTPGAQDLDPAISLEHLVLRCKESFLRICPFLSDVPEAVLIRQPQPRHLTLALASLGCLDCPGSEDLSLRLWQAAAMQLTGMLEVRSGEARNLSTVITVRCHARVLCVCVANLHHKGLILETYGFLSASPSVWRQTWMMHGYIKTVSWECTSFHELDTHCPKVVLENLDCRSIYRAATVPQLGHGGTFKTELQPVSLLVDVVENFRTHHTCFTRSLVFYFMLIDILRAIHYGQVSSFASFDISVSEEAMDSPAASPFGIPQIGEDHSLFAFFSILSLLGDIHTTATVLGPFAAEGSATREHQSQNGEELGQIPFAPKREMRELNHRLSEGLLKWKRKYLNTATKDVALLYYFCQLFHLVRHKQSLIILSGYYPRRTPEFLLERERRRVTKESHAYRAAVPVAWQLLETSELLPSTARPLWAALSVFSAGLVVWASMTLSIPEDDTAIPPRSLDPFQQELDRMNVPCAREMSATLSRLRMRASEGERMRQY